MFEILSISIAVLLALFLRKYATSRKQRRPYPPGPKPLPIIGNVFDLPAKDLANVYVEWGKKYNSSILHASALGNHLVVVNKLEDAVELFETRAAIYSDRPEMPVARLMNWYHNVAIFPYGEQWRYHRKICAQIFHQNAMKNYHGVMLEKVHQMLDGLLKTPEKFEHHNKMLSVSIPLRTMYGYDVESIDDPIVTNADKSVSLGAQLLLPGATLINIFPILGSIPTWLPGTSSHKIIAEVKRLTEEVIRAPMDAAKLRMSEGTAVPSLVTEFLEKKNTVGASAEEESAIEDIAYTVYGAASDTTISTENSFFYYMATHPLVQEKAQREIDRVIGGHRLPDFSDRAAMPYVEAIYREVLRSRPAAQLGFPHCVMEDDHYKGYLIPKGTVLLGNIWAMTHDESVYPEPFAFKPERFFNEKGELNDDDRILAFGFGRRVCVGEHLASAALWLTFASILATFNIGKAKDSDGQEIPINDEFLDFGTINHKEHFECSITPRSDEHERLIEAANRDK